jgi:hypothetical protein
MLSTVNLLPKALRTVSLLPKALRTVSLLLKAPRMASLLPKVPHTASPLLRALRTGNSLLNKPRMGNSLLPPASTARSLHTVNSKPATPRHHPRVIPRRDNSSGSSLLHMAPPDMARHPFNPRQHLRVTTLPRKPGPNPSTPLRMPRTCAAP